MTEPKIPGHTPDLVELSAYVDGELDAENRRRIDTHLAACPDCAALVGRFARLSADFTLLGEQQLGFDLAGVIEGRIAADQKQAGRPPATGWFVRWSVALGAAAALAAGTLMGSAVVLGSGASAAPRVASVRVFEAMPPGSLCVGLESCFVKGGFQ